jgi:hypothetical protein
MLVMAKDPRQVAREYPIRRVTVDQNLLLLQVLALVVWSFLAPRWAIPDPQKLKEVRLGPLEY